MSIQLRQGTSDDLPEVHGLVRELARFERAENEFVATLEEYRQDFADRFFQMVVAEDTAKQSVVGMALYYFTYSTWKGRMLYLEDFVVDPAYRSAGIGQRLWDVVLERGRERGCKLLKWQVLDWNEDAIRFYQRQDADIDTTWYTCKVPL